MKYSPYIEGVSTPPISEVKRWLAQIELPENLPLVDLCQAVPDYPPAPELVDHLKGLLDDPETSRYSQDEGLPEVRQSVSRWYGRRYGSAVNTDEICMTIGASQAFWLAMTVLCTAGDQVILSAPAYFDHAMGLEALGVERVWLPYREAQNQPFDLDEIVSLITPRTRALLLVSPSNPSGCVITAEALEALYDLVIRHDIALILDETYNSFLPPGTIPHRLFDDPDWGHHFIHLASFGKTFALTGYRAGALIAGARLIEQAHKIQDTMVVCQPRVTQEAIRYGCDHLDEWVDRNSLMLQDRHDHFCQLFGDPMNRFDIMASGGFFAWVKHPWPEMSSRGAVRRLLESSGVICLPGTAFGPGLDAYLRLAFGNLPRESAKEAVKRFVHASTS